MSHKATNKIIRVFPRRTKATPDDELAFVGDPPLFRPDVKTVHVSCTFTWDIPEAHRLKKAWASQGYNVSIGGPAFDSYSGHFTSGLYVKNGAVFTSRGCPRKCQFCFVPKREGLLRLLPIRNGWDVFDNNLLACPRSHIESVLVMLCKQPRAARFTGGIDARFCEPWFAKALAGMRLDILYTAYDHPGQQASVQCAVDMLREAGLSQRQVGCYVLVGYGGDTLQRAEERLEWVFGIGATPFAMYYRPLQTRRQAIPRLWGLLVRQWVRPAIIFSRHAGRVRRHFEQAGPGDE